MVSALTERNHQERSSQVGEMLTPAPQPAAPTCLRGSSDSAHAREKTALVLAILPVLGHTPVGMVGLFGLDQRDRTALWLLADCRAAGWRAATAAAELLAHWAFA